MALYFASTKERKYTWPGRRPGSISHSNGGVWSTIAGGKKGMLQLQPDVTTSLWWLPTSLWWLNSRGWFWPETAMACTIIWITCSCPVGNSLKRSSQSQQAASQPDSKHFLHSTGLPQQQVRFSYSWIHVKWSWQMHVWAPLRLEIGTRSTRK